MKVPVLSKRQWIVAGLALVLVLGISSIVIWNAFRGEPDEVADADGEGKPEERAAEKKRKAEEKKAKDKEEAEKKKKKEERPPEIDPPKLTIVPNDSTATGFQGIKPGHWMGATVELKANHRDWHTEMHTTVTVSRNNEPEIVPLENLPFYLSSRQPAILPKSQKKFIELGSFVPPLEGHTQPRLQVRVAERGGGDIVSVPSEPMAVMPAHQYYFVALAKTPVKYTYLKTLDCVKPPTGEFATDNRQAHYRISLPNTEKRVPLPSHLLGWTSIGYVLWDDVQPSVLTSDQQTALVDWLYFGGELLISGPDSLTTLQQPGGFLEPLLPATAGESRQISAEDLRDFNQPTSGWSFPAIDANKDSPKRTIAPVAPWQGIQLSPRPGAKAIHNTGDLVYEKRVGRGRIVVTAFHLSQPDLQNWWGFDGFFNACLLRRPPRAYRVVNDVNDVNDEQSPYTWADRTSFNDPRRTTNLRLLSRDFGYDFKTDVERERARVGSEVDENQNYYPNRASRYQTEPPDLESRSFARGIGAWDDFNTVSKTAAASLRDAAGIEIPRADFVMWSLIGYLAVLVPINWLLFKCIGRVEWAWIAAPILAILGTVAVTKMAHLDIGFTRSEREIAIVELQRGHQRGHVTRYSAHYSSLSSDYDFTFDDAGTQALPFATQDSFRLLVGQRRTGIEYRREEKTHVTGFSVSSNSTGIMHTEQVLDFGGGITLTDGDTPKVTNGTNLPLRNAVVVRQLTDQSREIALIGEMASGESHTVRFRNAPNSDEKSSPLFPDSQGATTNREALWTEGFVVNNLSQKLVHMLPGQTCLFAWTPERLPGVTSDPESPQQKRATLVVAHLEYPAWPNPQRDPNSKNFDKSVVPPDDALPFDGKLLTE